MNPSIKAALAATLLVSSAGVILAQEPSPEQGPATTGSGPGVGASVVSTLTATVQAVDLKNRVVTLKNPEGEVVDVVVGPEARNLPQLKVGDHVTVEYYEGLALKLDKGSSGIRERKETTTMSRTPLGEKPGGIVSRTVDLVGTIQAIDLKTRKVTIKGAKRTVVLKVGPAVDLENIKVGDAVSASYTEAVAISVTPAP